MQLFKKRGGHPRADLNHAYDQVIDWFEQIQNHRSAVLEGLRLTGTPISAIRGAVIAGRSEQGNFKAYARHLSKLPYGNIDFLTLDDLSRSLLEISRKVR